MSVKQRVLITEDHQMLRGKLDLHNVCASYDAGHSQGACGKKDVMGLAI